MQRMQRLLVVAAMYVACGSNEAPAPAKTEPKLAPGDAKPATSPTLPVPSVHLPDGATPLGYDLRLEVDPDRDVFGGTVKIRVHLDRASDRVWVHADELAIGDAQWDGGKITVVAKGDRMIALGFGKQVAAGDITLTLAFTGNTQHDEEGLFRQQDAGRWYLYSQGESEFARRITPCFDEPRWKTPWKVTVVAPKAHVIAGNMPVAHEQVLADGRKEVAFAETPAMPSYLLALAVGPFAVVDAGVVGKQNIPVRVLTFPRRVKSVASVAHQTGRLVALLEDYTAVPMPLAKLDVVTVPHLFGAMENPGLITFDADIVFDGDRRYAIIAAHELAHQWFGNYVTPVWWDDLWLSEAFASWLGERVAAQNEGHPPSEMHLAFTRESALAADGEAGAKPLHRAIAFDPDNAFDSIAYDKGEAVLMMFEAWAGPDKFRAALRAYLAAHAHGSVTTADLVKELAIATTPETANALAGYVDHAGAPVVELSLACEGTPTLTARARDRLSVPVCVRVPGNAHACALASDATKLPIGDACPAWVVANNGGYYHVVWADHGPRGPLPPWAKLGLGDKLALAADLASATSRGDLAPVDAIHQIGELAGSTDPFAQYTAVAIAQAIDPLVADSLRERWEAWLATKLAAKLRAAPRGMLEERIHGALLAMVPAARWPADVRAAAQRKVDGALAKKLAPWDSGLILVAGANRATLDKILAIARDPKTDFDQREAAIADLSAFGLAEVPAAVDALLQILPQRDAWTSVGPYFDRAATRAAAWTAVRAHLPELLAKLSPSQAGDLVDSTASLCDAKARA